MSTSGRRRLPAAFDDEAFGLDVGRYRKSSGRRVAEAARAQFEHGGVPLDGLMWCEEEGGDGTRLGGLLKIYLPTSGATVEARPFGMVFDPIRTPNGLVLNYVAFGMRHQPPGSRAPTVYVIAHRRLHA